MNKTLDTTAIIKGILEPRRKKQDAIFKEQFRIHKVASSILDYIYDGKDRLFVPTIVLVEIAAVASRLTGDEKIGTETAYFVKSIASRVVSENELLDEAVFIASKTKISGFDSVFIACAKITDSILITDDRKMYEAAIKTGIKSKLLRDISN